MSTVQTPQILWDITYHKCSVNKFLSFTTKTISDTSQVTEMLII